MTFLYVGAAMTIASFIGTKVFPIVSGQLMEHYPMTDVFDYYHNHFMLDIVHVGHIYWWKNHA